MKNSSEETTSRKVLESFAKEEDLSIRKVLLRLLILESRFLSRPCFLVNLTEKVQTATFSLFYFQICFSQIMCLWELCLCFHLQAVTCDRFFWLDDVAEHSANWLKLGKDCCKRFYTIHIGYIPLNN